MFVMRLRLFIAALWSHAGKRLDSWLSFVVFNCVFVTFPCVILGQVWYLIISFPDRSLLSYLEPFACEDAIEHVLDIFGVTSGNTFTFEITALRCELAATPQNDSRIIIRAMRRHCASLYAG